MPISPSAVARNTLVILACLAGCTTPPVPRDAAALPLDASAPNAPYLEVDPAASLIEVEVRAAGPLAPLGHEHLVALRSLRGWAMPQSGQASVLARVEDFTVDEPALRAAAGMARQPDAEAIEATRKNMLDKVLEAQRFPAVGARLQRQAEGWRLTLQIRGVAHDYAVAPLLEQDAAGYRARGSLTISQSDFAIEPFAALGGLLKVEDKLVIRFDIRAQKKAGPG